MKYCGDCGSTVEFRIPAGDNRERYMCDDCGAIHYQNPRMVVGTVPLFEGRVLLCKRAIEPRLGCWTLPAGFLENGETTEQGALRETREESLATVNITGLYRLFNVAHADQIHMFYLAEMTSAEYGITAESSEVALFEFADIPWHDIAFPTVHKTLLDIGSARQSRDYNFLAMDIDTSYWKKMRPA